MNIQRDEDFEKAYSEICKPIIARPYPRNEKGEYIYQEIHEAYLMWQAKAQAVPEGFVLVKKRNLIGNPNVDFLQAPGWAKYWLMDGYSKKYWWSSVRPKKDMDLLCYVWGGQYFVKEAPAFGFAGPWNESLTSKKAMIEAWEQNQEDAELNAIADSRKGQKRISVNIDEI